MFTNDLLTISLVVQNHVVDSRAVFCIDGVEASRRIESVFHARECFEAITVDVDFVGVDACKFVYYPCAGIYFQPLLRAMVRSGYRTFIVIVNGSSAVHVERYRYDVQHRTD